MSKFDGQSVNLFLDDDGEWLAHFVEMPNISAFGESPETALKELETAWNATKKIYVKNGESVPLAPSKGNIVAHSISVQTSVFIGIWRLKPPAQELVSMLLQLKNRRNPAKTYLLVDNLRARIKRRINFLNRIDQGKTEFRQNLSKLRLSFSIIEYEVIKVRQNSDYPKRINLIANEYFICCVRICYTMTFIP